MLRARIYFARESMSMGSALGTLAGHERVRPGEEGPQHGVCNKVNFTRSCVCPECSSGHFLWYWFWHLLRLWFLLIWEDSPDRADRYFAFYISDVRHVFLF